MIETGPWYIGAIEDPFANDSPPFPEGTTPAAKSKLSRACEHALNFLSKIGQKGYGGDNVLIDEANRMRLFNLIRRLYKRN